MKQARNQKQVHKGFRSKKVFAKHELNFVKNDSVSKIKFERLDKEYLLKRSGGNDLLEEKKILIIGCGSVGGYVAEYLASLGVKNITLIDNDTLKNENLYRHCLGLQYLGCKKIEALKNYLGLKYKDLSVTHYDKDAYKSEEIKDIINFDHDIIIILTGDENLNRKLNKEISKNIPILFGWLEPLGIGSHIVSSNIKNSKGCIECLYIADDESFTANKANFCAPHQNVRQIYAGCSGHFLPYSNLDAIRLALEITYSAVSILHNRELENFIKSQLRNREIFLAENFVTARPLYDL